MFAVYFSSFILCFSEASSQQINEVYLIYIVFLVKNYISMLSE